jgi:hypothetical protein
MIRGILSVLIIVLINMTILYSQPKIEIVGGDSYDWKRVSSKDVLLTASIKIKNSGDKKLIIDTIIPACGCTHAGIDNKELEPGATTSLNIVLNTTGAHGKVTKNVAIRSNDPKTKEKTLRLLYNVYFPIEIIPGTMISFGDMVIGKESETSFILVNNTKSPVTFSDLSISPSGQAKLNNNGNIVVATAEEHEIIVKASPTEKGEFKATINMKTDNSDYPEINIKCWGKVKE